MTSPRSESLASPRLWLAFATMLIVSGLANTFPVFFPALLAEFGGSRGATALTVSLMWLGGGVLGPAAGQLVDRWSPRLLVAAGLLASAAGLAGAIAAPSLPVFIAALGVGGGVGIGLTGMVVQAAVIADAYERRRGFAMGIVFSGAMAGYILSIPAQWAIAAAGWRATLGGYLGLVLVLVPLALAVYPARLAAHATGGRPGGAADRTVAHTLRSLPFWALFFVFAVAPMVGFMATVQHVLYFEALGFSPAEAAGMLGVGGILSTAGRAFFGLVADRVGAMRTGLVTMSMTLVGMLSLLGLEAWPVRPFAYAYVLFVFLPLGTRAIVVALLAQRIATPARFGSVFGWLVVGNSSGAALGPFLSGALYDLTRGYVAIYATAAVLTALAIGALLAFEAATRPPAAPGAAAGRAR